MGLELLRADIEQAGFGLPWDLGGVNYCEAAHDLTLTPWDDTTYNDTTDACTSSNPPRALIIGNGAVAPLFGVTLNNSDVLVVKATNVATNNAASKWTYITDNNSLVPAFTIQKWNSAQEDLLNTDYVIGLMPSASGARRRVLVNGGVQFSGTPADPGRTAGLQPVANTLLSNLVYGISPTGPLRMPFNRADYYIRRPAAGLLPTRCAPGTGVLYKSMVNHSDGLHTEMPILDCVADMHVVVGLDTNADNVVDTYNIPAGYTAQQVREQVKEVRVYILAHEGQRDASYTYTNPIPVALRPAGCVAANQLCIIDTNTGLLKNPAMVPDPNYRWKLYTLVVTPYNLR
jgi:hypothetical protein